MSDMNDESRKGKMPAVRELDVPVEQVDRDATADALTSGVPDEYCTAFREGRRDATRLVQAFARHRIAALASAQIARGGPDLVDALEWALAEIEGRTRYGNEVYSAEQWRAEELSKARAVLAKAYGK